MVRMGYQRVAGELDVIDSGGRWILKDGYIAYSAARLALQEALQRPCFDNEAPDGTLHWSPQVVLEYDKNADWDFAQTHPNLWWEPEDYWEARLFWQTCVEQRLGIYFTY